MVDRITPKPPAIDITALEQKLGTALGQTIMAEDFVQWVLEDNFAGEHPTRIGWRHSNHQRRTV